MKIAKIRPTKTTKIIIAIVMLMVIADYFIIKHLQVKPNVVAGDWKVFSSQELSRFDGSNVDAPIYLAYEGYVYDVSAGRDDFYGPGEAYHELAGKDSSVLLQIFGGDIIKEKYQIVGVYKP